MQPSETGKQPAHAEQEPVKEIKQVRLFGSQDQMKTLTCNETIPTRNIEASSESATSYAPSGAVIPGSTKLATFAGKTTARSTATMKSWN